MDSTEKITTRIAERREQTRELLKRDPILESLCDRLKSRFNAKLLYLEVGSVKLGTPLETVAIGWNVPKEKKRASGKK